MSRGVFEAAWAGMTRNAAFTSPTSEDPRLRGRTYAIPFETVWQACLALAGGELKRWEVLEHDDEEGLIRGRVRSRLQRFTSAVTIRVTLDTDAQTRVDGLAASKASRGDLGANARRLRRFFEGLDAKLGTSGIQPAVKQRTGSARAGAEAGAGAHRGTQGAKSGG